MAKMADRAAAMILKCEGCQLLEIDLLARECGCCGSQLQPIEDLEIEKSKIFDELIAELKTHLDNPEACAWPCICSDGIQLAINVIEAKR